MKLSDFLIKHNAYDKFIANCKRVKLDGECCLYSSFAFDETPEKDRFWGKIMLSWDKVRIKEFDMEFENGKLVSKE